MSDDTRARPAYGEYATPEEQRARIQAPIDAAEGVPVEPSAGVTPQDSKTPAPTASLAPVAAKSAPIRTGDRIATYTLLAVGLATILLSFSTLIQFPTIIATTFTQAGLGEFTSVGLATTLGWTAAIVQVVLWSIAFVLSRRAISLGRVSWWIPLVFGVVANLAVVLAVLVVVINDPAFMAQVSSLNS